MNKKFIIYLRSAVNNKSKTMKQTSRILEYLVESGHLAATWEECMNNLPHVTVFMDNRGSGLSALTDRPAGRKLIEHCASHPQPASNPGIVAIADQARLGRFDLTVHARAHRRLGRHGWKVHCVSAGLEDGGDYHDAVIELAELDDDGSLDDKR